MLVASLAASGCAGFEPSPSELPSFSVRIPAPEKFQSWHASTESCSGLAADFQTVEWYVVPDVDSFLVDGAPRVGMWQRVGGRSQIIIAGNYLDHEMVVRHEILHHLLGREGHPSDLFVEKCQLTWESWASRGTDNLASKE